MQAVVKSIPWLRLQNCTGRNIYIRPRGEHNLSLIDDLTAASIERMKAEGFHPALVVETSPGISRRGSNTRGVFRRNWAQRLARALAQEYEGDLGAADWRHFGRLAGFTKPKRKIQG
jgi:RepB DNA-primase from phage plasmid